MNDDTVQLLMILEQRRIGLMLEELVKKHRKKALEVYESENDFKNQFEKILLELCEYSRKLQVSNYKLSV